MRDELRDRHVEGGLHEFRRARGAQAQVQAFQPFQPADGRPEVERIGGERHAEDDRLALRHGHARARDPVPAHLYHQHLVEGRVLVGKEVEVVLPCLDGGHAVVEIDDPGPARKPLRELPHRRRVHGDLAADAVAHHRVGMRRILGGHERGIDELRHVARASHARGENDLVLRGRAPDHVAVDADARIAVGDVRGAAFRDARVVERAAIVVPGEARVEPRPVDGHAGVARAPHFENAQRRILAAAQRHPVGDEPAVRRWSVPVDGGARRRSREAGGIDQHPLGAGESVAHVQHGRVVPGEKLQVEHLPVGEGYVAHAHLCRGKLADTRGQRRAPGDPRERAPRVLVLRVEERLRIGRLHVLQPTVGVDDFHAVQRLAHLAHRRDGARLADRGRCRRRRRSDESRRGGGSRRWRRDSRRGGGSRRWCRDSRRGDGSGRRDLDRRRERRDGRRQRQGEQESGEAFHREGASVVAANCSAASRA